MIASPLNVILSVGIGAMVLYAMVLLARRRVHGPLPPGPPGKPILGNIYDLPPPGAQDWMHWLKFKDRYGQISSISVMGQTIVILNHHQIAMELLGKRSAIYSSRPNLVFASQMVGWEHILAMQTYSDRLRAYRKAMQPYLGSETAVSQYNELQEVESHRFLLRVLKDPKNLIQHISTEAGAVILKIAYGYTIEPDKMDPLVHIAKMALEQFSVAGTPGAWLVDVFPALRYIPSWFPGAGFKRTAQVWKQNLQHVADKPYAFVRQRMESGNYDPSYLSNLFEAGGYPPNGTEEEMIAKWTAASLYTGGADTTVSSIQTFFLAMTLYPEVQRKAQEEIDRILGGARLPTVVDRASLPYVDAIVKETLRWHPVAPMGIPHMSVKDDIYEGHLIPEGSLVLANIWAFAHDTEVYHEPMKFKPERFLNVDGREPELDPRTFVFGFGRRICPGRILADYALYLIISRSLAVFDVRKEVRNGHEVHVEPEFRPGVISHPLPWEFNIKPRSASCEALIRSVEETNPWRGSDAAALDTS
ncbi:hypothetical protein CBS147311_251 [Penicillium roqueforti]|nr:hypothetical protein CBS147311_251 [Penicillium roqueforti]